MTLSWWPGSDEASTGPGIAAKSAKRISAMLLVAVSNAGMVSGCSPAGTIWMSPTGFAPAASSSENSSAMVVFTAQRNFASRSPSGSRLEKNAGMAPWLNVTGTSRTGRVEAMAGPPELR